MPTYKSLKFHKRIKHPRKLPSAWVLFKRAIGILWKSKKLFLGIVLIYGVLNVILVQGFGSTSSIQTVKNALDGSSGFVHIVAGLSLFAGLVASSGNNATAAAGVYQLLLVLIISLVIIWTMRQLSSGKKVRIRDGFYQGTYPLVPFILVILVFAVQLVPAAIGAGLYTLVTSTGIASLLVEKWAWGTFAALLGLLSLYMVTSSLFALYIVTLPNMTPMKALRTARELVRYRRWTILRKVLFLPLALFVVSAIIVVPIILTITAAAPWVFFILSMFVMIIMHAYLYTLYRELLL